MKQSPMDKVVEALEGCKPALVAEFQAEVARAFEHVAKAAAEMGWNRVCMRGMVGPNPAYQSYRFVSMMLAFAPHERVHHPAAERVLDQTLVEREAARYAESVVTLCGAKIRSKVEELDEAVCESFAGFSHFYVTGTRAGRKVEIKQRRILNVSKNGNLFNQFPARIKVDGKAVSEAAYKAMFVQD